MLKEIKLNCERYPERNAFCFSNVYYTYRQFEAITYTIQSAFKNKLSKGSKLLAIVPHEDIFTYCSIFAAYYSGIGFVPLHPDNPYDRNAEIIRQSGVQIILTSRTNNDIEKIKNTVFPKLEIIDTSSLDINLDKQLAIPELNESTTAYLFFTSGSTGVPKGVPISYKNLYSFIDAFFALGYKLDENDRFLQMFDLTFDLSHMSYIIPLIVGGCVYPVPENGIKYMQVVSILEDKEITFALMVPSVLAFLRNYLEDIQLEKMRYSLFCGEALYDDLTSIWQKSVPNALIQNVYGPTEATIFCLTYDWSRKIEENKSFNSIVSIGKPMKNMNAIVVNEDLKNVVKGEKGEICLSGNQLTEGYLNDAEKNKKAFFIDSDGIRYYRTGDLGFVDREGNFMYAGRIDHQVKINGFRVELGEIEHHVRLFALHVNVVALAVQKSNNNDQIILCVEDVTLEKNTLFDYLKTKLPSYMMPVDIREFERFPLNSNGKTDRKVLKKMVETNG